MIDLIKLAVPASMSEIWWVYDLMLVGVIIIAAIVLSILKKRTFADESKRLVKLAQKNLSKAKKANGRNAKLRLFRAKNELSSASAALNQHISESGAIALKAKADNIVAATSNIDGLIKNFYDVEAATREQTINEALKLLG